MAVAPGDFLSTFEAQVAEHWDATRATHASLAEHIVKKDLPGLMTYDKEDPHGILALAPAQLEPCADVVSGFGEAAMACAAEFEFFLPAAEEDLGALLESCSENTYEAMADDLRVAYAREELAVERTKSAIEGLDGLSLTGALLQKMEQTKVDQMDDEEKAEQFEKMQSQLHLEHVEQTKGAVSALLSKSHLPPLHDQVEARQLLLDALKRKADAVSSKEGCGGTSCLPAWSSSMQMCWTRSRSALGFAASPFVRKRTSARRLKKLRKRGRSLGKSTRMPTFETRQRRF